MTHYSFNVNGTDYTVDVPGDLRFLWVLRDVLGLTGTKYGCGMHECRACTALAVDEPGSTLNPIPFATCSTPVSDVAGRNVITIEGLAHGDQLSPVHQAWLEVDVPQCGYCQGGQILCATGLLAANPNPTDADIDQILNICRCGTYYRIREAIKLAAKKINGA
ncbi:MAG TPA: (2Fe-2S)-binding protein [Acidimicrobiales bacterium]|nr:(2Fe-2S)-binding protein [Acidimicrobiales bacterium]